MEKPPRQTGITLIMPALDEEANIGPAVARCLESFDRLQIAGEVLVVNDGSHDATPAIVGEMMKADPRVRMISHERPLGIGASFRDGVREARGEAVAMMPGDNENDPAETLRYLPLLEHVDLVIPFVFNREVRGKKRNFYSSLYLSLVNFLFRRNFNYTNGTVIYRREVLAGAPNRSDGFFYQTENLVRAARGGYLYAEVPYRLELREQGESKAVSLKSLKRIAGDCLRLAAEVYFGGPPPAPAEGTVTARRRVHM